jgi:hypothetical protein
MKVNKASDSTCKHRAADWIARKPLFFLNFVFGTRYHLLENNMNKYRVRDTNFYVKNPYKNAGNTKSCLSFNSCLQDVFIN